jgi:2-polyprenyl-6-methoxyphenol hydroxylase-like FAD-dependent oxidoreductase
LLARSFRACCIECALGAFTESSEKLSDMDRTSRILISGAGVAGLTCAAWLGRAGFRPVVIERSPAIRADGYIISLSHASYHYAAKLGLLDKIRSKNSGISQSSYHDRHGRAMLELDYEDLFAGIDVVQIMRDDLQAILHEAARDFAEIRLGTSITAIDDSGDETEVTFSNGESAMFDVVIGADGLHSNTRNLVWPEQEVTKHFLGLFSSAYRLPNTLGLKRRFENHMERDRYMCVYTTRDDDLACVFIWQCDDRAPPPAEARRAALARWFDGAPALVRQVLAEFPDTGSVYMDPLIQIELETWSRGNVVLLGDAAHCLTLLSGQGASSAFWGACSLAEALCEQTRSDAFATYGRTLKPVTAELQPATRRAARWYVPQTKLRYVARDAAMRYLPNAFYQRYFKRKYSKA